MASESTHIQARAKSWPRLAPLRLKHIGPNHEPLQTNELSESRFNPIPLSTGTEKSHFDNSSQLSKNSCSDTLSESSTSLKASIPVGDRDSTERITKCDAKQASSTSSSDTLQQKLVKDALREAVKNGVVNVVESMLPLVKKMALSTGSYSGGGCFMDVLMIEAIENKKCTIMEIIVRNGANLNSTHRGKLHLTRALLLGDYDLIYTLLKLGADVRARELSGKTALHVAAASCSDGIVRHLLDNGSDIEARDKVQGDTAMHIACAYSNREAVMALYKRGAEFNSANDNGHTPLSKLLTPVTKADDFHNRSRIALAEELIKLGFVLPTMRPYKLTGTETMRGARRNGWELRAKHRKNKHHIQEDSLDCLCSQTTQRGTQIISSAHLSKEEKVYRLYEKLIQKVSPSLSLQQHCRLSILRSLDSKSFRVDVKQLGLPKLVQEYIISGDTRGKYA